MQNKYMISQKIAHSNMTIGLYNKFVHLPVQSVTILPKASKDKVIRNSKISYISQKDLVANYVLN